MLDISAKSLTCNGEHIMTGWSTYLIVIYFYVKIV